jgi:hypothetical protein
MSSDFASLKNDDGVTVSVTVPGGQVVGASSKFTVSTDVTVGTKNAAIRAQVTSSKFSGATYVTHQIYFLRSGTVTGLAATYDVYAYVTRPDATTLMGPRWQGKLATRHSPSI